MSRNGRAGREALARPGPGGLARTLLAALGLIWRAHRGAFAGQVVVTVLAGLAPVAAAWLLRVILDLLVRGDRGSGLLVSVILLGAVGGVQAVLPSCRPVPVRAGGPGKPAHDHHRAVQRGEPASGPAQAGGSRLSRPAQRRAAGGQFCARADLRRRRRHRPGDPDPGRLRGHAGGAQPGHRRDRTARGGSGDLQRTRYQPAARGHVHRAQPCAAPAAASTRAC